MDRASITYFDIVRMFRVQPAIDNISPARLQIALSIKDDARGLSAMRCAAVAKPQSPQSQSTCFTDTIAAHPVSHIIHVPPSPPNRALSMLP